MNSHLQSIIDCIEQIRLEWTENHSLEADDYYTAWFNDALQAVLSKIEELWKSDTDFVKNCERFMR